MCNTIVAVVRSPSATPAKTRSVGAANNELSPKLAKGIATRGCSGSLLTKRNCPSSAPCCCGRKSKRSVRRSPGGMVNYRGETIKRNAPVRIWFI